MMLFVDMLFGYLEGQLARSDLFEDVVMVDFELECR